MAVAHADWEAYFDRDPGGKDLGGRRQYLADTISLGNARSGFRKGSTGGTFDWILPTAL